MTEKNVPKDILQDNSFGNMIIEQENNNSMNEIKNQDNTQKIKPHVLNNNRINSNVFPSTNKTKLKHKNSIKLKGDKSNSIKCKIKNSLSLRNTLKVQKNKNKYENENSKKLSIKQKINQSNIILMMIFEKKMRKKKMMIVMIII